MRNEADHQYKDDNPDDDPGTIAAAMHSSVPPTEPSYKNADAHAKIGDINKAKPCGANVSDGPKRKIAFNVKDSYVDEYTGETLDSTLTREAIITNLNTLVKHVWAFMNMKDARREILNGTYIGGRWVRCSKGG